MISSTFERHFGAPPDVLVRAPGRVNLLGGHTDYNEGFVLPVAIDRAAWVAARRLHAPEARVAALDVGETATFALEPLTPRAGEWADYPRGVAWALQAAGHPTVGMEAALTSTVPVGAGLSSSAAVEVAFAWAWRTLAGLNIERAAVARICQRAENDYVGVKCGIMDQMASACGQEGHALLLDCRTLEVAPVPLPAGVAILVADTGVRRALAASAYNERRRECEEAVRILSQHLPGLRALRDVSPDDFRRTAHYLPEVVRKRARHVVTDNARVLEAVAALQTGDLARVGDAMRRCHVSLRDDYAVSSPELDLLAETAWAVEGCYGARLTGAGFGGCAVALTDEGAVEGLVAALETAHLAAFDRTPAIYRCKAAEGVAATVYSPGSEKTSAEKSNR
ncbi:MAG: galactokinase [Anaerolineae bacterium]|nr:galactokinase [Anaerolineae bacterium]